MHEMHNPLRNECAAVCSRWRMHRQVELGVVHLSDVVRALRFAAVDQLQHLPIALDAFLPERPQTRFDHVHRAVGRHRSALPGAISATKRWVVTVLGGGITRHQPFGQQHLHLGQSPAP